MAKKKAKKKAPRKKPPAFREATADSAKDILEPSPSGMARCQACRKPIADGDWRFGAHVGANAEIYDGARLVTFHRFFHAACAAEKKATGLLRLLTSGGAPNMPAREWYSTRAAIALVQRKPIAIEEVLWFHDGGEGLPHAIFRTAEGKFGCLTKLKRKGKPHGAFGVDLVGSKDDAFALLPEALFRAAKAISVSRPAPPAPLPARVAGPIAHCPRCEKGEVVARGGYVCSKNCGFRFSTRILQREIEPEQLKKWIVDGRTDVLDGFISKKTGRPFSAFLVRNGRDAMAFAFPER